jgi:predicted O-methyltransferase YrrM
MIEAFQYPTAALQVKLLAPENRYTLPWEKRWLLWRIGQMEGAGNVLEIGTLFGDTAFEIASAFPTRKVICLDALDAGYNAMGLTAETVCRSARGLPNVELRIGNSRDFVYADEDRIRFIFIDGDHSWDGLRADTERALQYAKGGRIPIVWHDYAENFEVMYYLKWLANRGTRLFHVNGTTLVVYEP